jgi:DNA-binding transcriptional MocR family regulator
MDLLGTEDLGGHLQQYRGDYKRLLDERLSLDLTRGKPSSAQLELADPLLRLPDGFRTADGIDARNYYGDLRGLRELREIWGPLLDVPAEQLVTGGNSSLALMHDCMVNALLNGTTDGPRWVDTPSVAFLCPVPGYDRHFGICERFGIEMIPVPMRDDGPDLARVRELVAGDARIKGMWCVPKYSNPTGVSYSDDVVRELASMPTAAADFRLFWDNAYALHDHGSRRVEIADVLAMAADSGHPDRPLLFASTSKITFAGSGQSFFGGSPANVEWLLAHLRKRTIGPDKVNELRHAQFLPDADAVRAHMDEHAAILRPKFDAVDEILTEMLGGTGVASWTRPEGGYFVSLDVLDGCAARVVALAKDAGVALTPAGATHPYGNDPADRTLRLAPTFPPIDELITATRALATCVLLAAAEVLAAR